MRYFISLVLGLVLALASAQSGVLNYNSNASDPEPKRVDELLVEMFKEANPDINFEHTQVDHEGFKQAIRTYFASANPPEVMTWFAGNRMRFFANRDVLLNINDVWADNGWEDIYPKGFQASSKYDGNYVFVPTSYYWWAVYYRKDVFNELNLATPQNWAELLATCDALRDAGYVPFTIGTRFLWPTGGWFDYLNMRVNGPEFHTALTDGTVSYESEEVRAVFAHWKELLDHDCFIENPSAYNWQEAAEFMVKETPEAAMYLMGDFIRDLYPDDREATELDFFRFPLINDVPVGEDAPTDGFFAAAEGEDKELAKRFLAFLGSKEAQEVVAKELGRIVPRNDIDTSLYPDYVQKGLDEIINKADVVMQFYDRDTTPEMAQAGMNGFVEFMANPNRIDRILQQLERERQQIFGE